MKYRDFLTLCARQRIGVVLVGVIAGVVVDVVVGVVVGIVTSLCRWCSCGIALRASWYSCRWYCVDFQCSCRWSICFFLLRSYGVVLLVSLAFVQGGLARSLAFVRGHMGNFSCSSCVCTDSITLTLPRIVFLFFLLTIFQKVANISEYKRI